MDTYPHEASHIELGFNCDEEVAIGFQVSHKALDHSAATTAAGLQRSNVAKVILANTHRVCKPEDFYFIVFFIKKQKMLRHCSFTGETRSDLLPLPP